MAKKEIFNDLNLVLRLNQHIEEIVNEHAPKSLLTKETSFKVLAELSSITNPDPREDAQFDHQRAAFLAQHGASGLPFHLQGDQSFNEASVLAKRRALRHSGMIKERISFLWEVARGQKNSMLASTVPSTSMAPSIAEEQYVEMMLLVFKVLRDDFILESARAQIHCDWEVDSHHCDTLGYDQFFAALFELVDVWTCDVLEETYGRFLQLLARRITLRVVVFFDDQKLKLALSDNFDDAVVVKAIPLSTIKQFASVAKVMEGNGVRTIGELAQADPKTIETHRVSYLNRNQFSKEKIGTELQNLLQMFRDISTQFQTYQGHRRDGYRGPIGHERGSPIGHQRGKMGNGMEYDAQGQPILGGIRKSQQKHGRKSISNSLSRRSSTSSDYLMDFHEGDEETKKDDDFESNGDGTEESFRVHSGFGDPGRKSNGGYDSRNGRRGQSGSGDGGHFGRSENGGFGPGTGLGMRRKGTGVSNASEGFPGSDDSSGTGCSDGSGVSGGFGGSARSGASGASGGYDVSDGFGGSGDFGYSGGLGGLGCSGGSDDGDGVCVDEHSESSLIMNTPGHHLPRGIHRINTFHDLSVTDTGVLDALKVSFLMEKNISLVRKTDPTEVMEELRKFGVEIAPEMTVPEMMEKYNSLYEMFVLRDGENIRALAQTVLTRIKAELAAHGIIVNDDEVEAMYDGFYGSVVAGSGEKIVTDAKNWVDETVRNNSVSSYIKQEYYELRPIDDVKLLGTECGDEEFLSLLSTESENEGNGGVTPAQRASPSRRPSLIRTSDMSAIMLERPIELPIDTIESKKTASLILEPKAPEQNTTVTSPRSPRTARSFRNTHKAESKVKTPVTSKTRKVETKMKPNELSSYFHSATAETTEKQIVDAIPVVSDHATSEIEIEIYTEPIAVDGDDLNKEGNDLDGVVTSEKRAALALLHTRATVVASDNVGGKLSRIDVVQNEVDRVPQRIDFSYGVDELVIVARVEVPVESRVISTGPKVPDIIIGGVDSGTNSQSIARYVQLLGIGNVSTIKQEAELMKVLQSDVGQTTDLVCFDIGKELDKAVAKTDELCQLVGRRVILFGGDENDVDRTRTIAFDCVQHGAIYFAVVPISFPELRAEMLSFFESSARKYVLRQHRRPAGAGQMSRVVTTSMHNADIDDEHLSPRKISTPLSFADSAKQSRRLRAVPALPQVISTLPATRSSTASRPMRTIEEMGPPSVDAFGNTIVPRGFTPVVPQGSSPRAASSGNGSYRTSPRISATLKKLMR